MSVRQRKEILDRLVKDFEEYNLPQYITYSGYSALVVNPVLPRAIRKTYGNWTRVLTAVQLSRPKAAPKVQPVLKAETKPVEMPKAAVKPSTKPAPAVSKSK